MTGMITLAERPMGRHNGFGVMPTTALRLSRLAGGADKRHRHNQPVASLC